MLAQGSGAKGIKEMPLGRQFLFRLLIGCIAASCSLPATVALDQLFWTAQRVTNAKRYHADEQSTEVQLIARASLHCALESFDTRQLLMRWRLAIEELRVVEMQHQLLRGRLGRLALRQSGAIEEKAQRELEHLARDFEATGRTAEAFASLVAAIAASRADGEQPVTTEEPVTAEELVIAAAVRVQRAYKARRARKHLQSNVAAAKLVARRWRARQFDAERHSALDDVIDDCIVRVQHAI
eukprot:3764830-Prymnesium_polylepis.1